MSVRAYRIIKIDVEESYDSFNLWHDSKLVSFLDEEASFFSSLSTDGTGVTEVSVETLEGAVKQADKLGIDTATVENLKKDIAWAKSQDAEYVQYYCY